MQLFVRPLCPPSAEASRKTAAITQSFEALVVKIGTLPEGTLMGVSVTQAPNVAQPNGTGP